VLKKRPNCIRFEPLGEVIDRVLPQCRPNHDPALLGVWKIWDQAVGAQVATHARPAAFKGSILLVHVASSTWLHHLRFLENDIRGQLNLALGGDHVHAIKWKVGPI
jgi:predicted nucleic acid-binding Zn ribbon protein